jgi:Trk K+ transport system NAD-binding subunit
MIDAHVLVLGGGQVGCRLAEDLFKDGADGVTVGFLDGDETAVERAIGAGVRAAQAPVSDADSTVVAATARADRAFLASGSDSTNLLLAQRIRLSEADIETVVVINDPRNREAFEALGVETVCLAAILSEGVREQVSGGLTAAPGRSGGEGDARSAQDRSPDRRDC